MPRLVECAFVAAAAFSASVGAATGCKGVIHLTFDTGNMSQAQFIADTLNKEHVKATFFLANEKTYRGDRALDPGWRDFWRARVAEGNTFGNHTWHHYYERVDIPGGKVHAVSVEGRPVTLDEKGFCAELTRVDGAFHALTGARLSPMWRAPGGRTTQQTVRWAADCGFPVHVGWSDGGYLGDDLPSERYPNAVLLKRALAHAGNEHILLMHLGIWSRHVPLAPVLPELIRDLKAKGYCFAPLKMGAP